MPGQVIQGCAGEGCGGTDVIYDGGQGAVITEESTPIEAPASDNNEA